MRWRHALCALRFARLTTPRKTAGAADNAATFMFNCCTTVGAGTHFGYHVGETALTVFIECLGHSVGATEHHLALLPDGRRTPDAHDLFQDGFRFDS